MAKVGPGRDGTAWALFFVRWVLGLIFFMAGFWKTFELGPAGHVRRYFLGDFAATWIPTWLLWTLGLTIPIVELVAGALVCLGWRRREAYVALGFVLVVVTYGHLLLEPLYDTTHHIFPRLILLVLALVLPPERDALSVDAWLARRKVVDPQPAPAPSS
ncbi:MAG TPA: MauE/DoxX family redox-associated membrane protein [Thermoanaerobaculia bacterium]